MTGREIADPEGIPKLLGFDSMTMLDMLPVLEKRFDIVFSEDAIMEFASIGRIAPIVEDALRKSGIE